jgi:hypothetical protein
VIISADDNIAIAFKTDINLNISSWDINNGSILLTDNTNTWNILGQLIDGEQHQLASSSSYITYWFAAAAMYPEVKIFDVE